MTTAAERMAKALQRHGVEVIFGQSLPVPLVLACEDLGIKQVVYRTENAGGAMADGFARISKRIGVVTSQNGPAATLLVAPLAEALKASIPILALVQDVPSNVADRNAFQELDHVALFTPCAKWVRQVTDPNRIEDYVDLAIVAATSGRPGPAVLLLSPEMLLTETPEPARPRTAVHGHWPLDRSIADPAAVAEAARLIAGAKRPLIVAGGGVHSSGAADALAAVQELAHVPVAYTMMGKGSVSDSHPLTVGLVGNVMGRRSLGLHTRALIDEADLVMFVGNRTNQNGTDSWTLFKGDKTYIHLDMDGLEISRNYESAVRLCGDAKLTLEALAAVLKAVDLSGRAAARAAAEDQLKAARAAWTRDVAPLRREKAGQQLRPEHIMLTLNSMMRGDDIVVADASYSSIWINNYLDAALPGQRFLTPRGVAGLGEGYPMALGAKVAAPHARVVCVSGDGGFGHCWAELETAKRNGLGVILIVLNNAILGFEKDAETMRFGRHTTACFFEPVDHAKIATACGVAGHTVRTHEELRAALSEALSKTEPYLLDVHCDPDAWPPLTMYEGKLSDKIVYEDA